MPTILLFLAIAAGLWVAWAVMRGRFRGLEDRIIAATARARSHKPTVLKVSPVDGAFIGLCFDKAMVVVGDADSDRTWSLHKLASADLLLNGEAIARAGPESRSDPAPFEGEVRELALCVSVRDGAEPPSLVRFLQWPAPGLQPGDPVVRDAASEAYGIFQRLAEGMAKAAAVRSRPESA